MALILKKVIPRSYSLCGGRNLLNQQRLLSVVAALKYSHKINTEMANSDCNNQEEQLLKKLEVFQWLGNETPCFSLNGDQIQVINEPRVFYSTLLEKASKARSRITLASLYLGNGNHEKDLVDSLENCLVSNSECRIRILLDANRGSRGSQNSRTMLLPLIKSHESHCSVHFYHTPALRGYLKSILPERWNEIIGLQHMKIYIFDNTLLISGANLSHDYFTNRQDRYLIVEDCKNLADFYDRLIETVSQFSFQLNGSNELELDPNCKFHPYEKNAAEFTVEAREKIEDLLKEQHARNPLNFHEDSRDTWIFPFIQMGQLGIFKDNIYTEKIFKTVPSNAELSLATGYFNLTQDYLDSILNMSQPNVHILMAHPTANGFLSAKGFAGGIPSAYTLLASQFYQQVVSRAHSSRIRLWEYRRSFWTFHAKGLWISFTGTGDPRPVFTLIGSPNFGYRSVYRDLESQLAIVTVNSSLRDQLDEERRNLFQSGEAVTSSTFKSPDRSVPLWVRFVIKVFRHFF